MAAPLPTDERPIDGHRWSGWPGSWCLDCGISDPTEVCIVIHDEGCKHAECDPGSCPEPGSNRHNPYARR